MKRRITWGVIGRYNCFSQVRLSCKVFRFDRNELDLGRYELRRAGRRIPLSRIPMEFLILLLEEHGNLVPREKIAEILWTEPETVDVTQGINAAVKRIRAVLNDDATKPRFIETVIGKGYRFIGDVQELDGATDSTSIAGELGIEPLNATVPNTPRAHSFWFGWMIFVIVAAVSAAAAWYWKSPRFAGSEPDFRQVTTLVPENRATAAAISSGGRLIVYANVDGVFIRTKNGDTTALRAPRNFVVDHLAWFSGGTELLASGFSSVSNIPEIWAIYVTGAPPRLLRSQARDGSPAPDGTQIVFTNQNRSEIWKMGASGEDAVRLAGPAQDTFPLVFWAAGGQRIAFQRRHYAPERRLPALSGTTAQFDIYYDRSYESIDAESGKLLAKMPDIWMDSAAALPDGRLLFLRWNPPGSGSEQLWEVRTNPSTGGFLDAPREIAEPVEENERLKITGMSATADGKQVLVLRESNQNAVFTGDFNFAIGKPSIRHMCRLTLDDRTNYPHAWTRDSRAVIFESDRNGNYDLFKQNIDKRVPESIVETPFTEVLPQLSPDGRWVLYDSRAPDAKQMERKLMRVPIDGGIPEEVPIGGWLDEFRCALEIGKRCVLRNTIQDESYIYYDLDPYRGKGRELARTSWVPEYVADWDISPDGTQIAIPNHDARNARIRVITLRQDSRASSEREVVLPGRNNLSGLNWAADGKGWFVSVETTVGNQLLYVWMDGRSQLLGDIQGWAVPSLDGRRLAFLNRIIATNAWLIERH